jgi:hypothetical protein
MKNIQYLSIIVLACGILILNNCSTSTQDAPANLRPYNNASLTYTISSYSNSYGFLFYSSANWKAFITCKLGDVEIFEKPSVNPASGEGSAHIQSINFTVPDNNTENTMTYYLTIVSGDKNLVVIIRQRSDLGSLSVDPTEIHLPALGGNASINVESNVNWYANAQDSWFLLSPQSGIGNDEVFVTVSATHNKTVFRSSSLIFQADTMTRIVNISQHAFCIIPPSQTTVTYEGPHIMEFSVISSLSWVASCNSNSWCTISTLSHDASETMIDNQITIQANPGSTRTVKITVENSDGEKQNFSIIQKGDLSSLLNTNWSGTATVNVATISKTGSMSMTIVDEDNVIVRGYPGQITYLSDNTIQFQIFIDEITYEGFTGYNVTAYFEGNISADQSSISGTLTGNGTVLGINLNVTGNWYVTK